MTDTMTTVDTYFEMWNEADPARRAELVAQVWTDEGRHVDPLADVEGHDAIDRMIAGVQAQFPGHRVRRTSSVDRHHDQLRYRWELAAEDGTPVVSAVDGGEIDDRGRLRRVSAFFGELS